MRKVLIALALLVMTIKSNAQTNLYPSPYGYIQIKDDVNIPAAFIQGGSSWSYFGNLGRNPLTFGNSGNYHHMVIFDNGNVGIGTLSPAAKLHIGQNNSEIRFDYDGTNSHYGSLRWAGLQFGNNGQNRIIAGRSAPGGFLDFYVNNTNDGADYYTSPNGTLAMRINPEGKVGIGTANPEALLHVSAGNKRGGIRIGGANGVDNGRIFIEADLVNDKSYIDVYGDNTYKKFFIDASSLILNTNSTGNVGIGTATPSEKLAVNGKIRAQEIKVEASPWPDYVFAKDYPLPSLQQTESHIKEKGHLPGIPSAAEVKANGIDLGEMNAKLLQKIEELTLYAIEQSKKINKLEDIITRNDLR